MTQVVAETRRTGCCIAGGGPAGMVLGLLLARAGIDVTVLEKHGDFLRDFRGDTIHASTIRIMDELGLGERFREVPHQAATRLHVLIGGETAIAADLTGEDNADRRLWFMPQWDFLDFVADEARRYPSFHLLMDAEVTGVAHDGGRVAGVRYHTDEQASEIRSYLTVACDGRDSTLRKSAGLEPVEFGVPMDVLWFRLAKPSSDASGAFFCVGQGGVLILIDRGDYWQAGYVIAKGSFAGMEGGGVGPVRNTLARLAPFLDDGRLQALSWQDLKLLHVQVNRLRRWHRPGLLLVGDAAHAMSPVGGVGINLAIQDAVAAANALAGPLAQVNVSETHLARVQRRRAWPTIATQTGQRVLQRQFLGRVLAGGEPHIPTLLRRRFVQRLVPRLIGIGLQTVGSGVRPEHVRTPSVPSRAPGTSADV